MNSHLIFLLTAGIAILFAFISLVAGIVCIVRYFKTRKIALLIFGLILTFLVPGICLCLALALFIPSMTVVYGPPPSITP